MGAVGQTIDEESTQALSRAMDTQPHGTVSSLLLDGIKPNQHHQLETVSESDKQPIGTHFFQCLEFFKQHPRSFVVDVKKTSCCHGATKYDGTGAQVLDFDHS